MELGITNKNAITKSNAATRSPKPQTKNSGCAETDGAIVSNKKTNIFVRVTPSSE